MRDCHDRFGYIIDPHGAVGYHAWMKKMRQRFPDTHGVVLETAHPAKFGNVVKDALGLEVVVPERLATIIRKEKNASLISPSLIDLKAFLLSANRS
jgi:threonine synthase